ncbi:hypothetical protein LEP1GSC039_2060 [Leptospira santarosai str. 2000027870]|nr:hypothetical protein LEP1GSC039_2060 [Leptospira santarosai str. 2000027870]
MDRLHLSFFYLSKSGSERRNGKADSFEMEKTEKLRFGIKESRFEAEDFKNVSFSKGKLSFSG